jgi:hypothetical protein
MTGYDPASFTGAQGEEMASRRKRTAKESPRDEVGFLVRIPNAFFEWLKREAAEQRRSINAQLVHILQQHYAGQTPAGPDRRASTNHSEVRFDCL